MITFNNYHLSTIAVFKGCKIPKRDPDYISNSNSKYWYCEDKNGKYIIRSSDHWVNIKYIGNKKVYKDCRSISSCTWHLNTNNNNDYIRAGKAYLNSFKRK